MGNPWEEVLKNSDYQSGDAYQLEVEYKNFSGFTFWFVYQTSILHLTKIAQNVQVSLIYLQYNSYGHIMAYVILILPFDTIIRNLNLSLVAELLIFHY